MSAHVHFDEICRKYPVSLTLTLFFLGCRYLFGWIPVRLISRTAIPAWRATCYFLGLFAIWAACASPFAAYDHNLLTVHMIKHLLLMTFAPALILLGEPARVFWIGIPLFARHSFSRVWQRSGLPRFAGFVTRPALCWTVSALTLLAWHSPALFALGMRSEMWHTFEQATFFAAGLMFWWPVVQPWPSARTSQSWSILLYLFLATLPCDFLSGFLVFSERVAYPMYISAPRLFGFSALEDQQCAAALMWTCVTIVYLVPAAIISTKLLGPRTSQEGESAPSELAAGALRRRDSTSLEVV